LIAAGRVNVDALTPGEVADCTAFEEVIALAEEWPETGERMICHLKINRASPRDTTSPTEWPHVAWSGSRAEKAG
jgi:hypothetical protein